MDTKLTSALATWDDLALRLDRFLAAWNVSAAPPLAPHLPAEPPALRRLVLVELIKVDLERRQQTPALFRRVEDYAAEFPELVEHAEGLPTELVYEEYLVRKAGGVDVSRGEYIDRFPAQAAALQRLLDLNSSETTTALSKRSRPDEIVAGQQLDDFDLLTLLGKGAFACVFLARQRSMQRLVALKISADRGTEPQTLAQLDHPHIVRVYDQRQLADRRLKLLYMQYVAGGTLAGVVERAARVPFANRTGKLYLEAVNAALEAGGDSPPSDSLLRRRLAQASWRETICRLGAQLAGALDYAHQRGVLHRDIKPANVLLAADGAPKLADFNISWSSSVAGATAAAYFGGSLAYMSPEQLEASNARHTRQPEELDGRSDIYSLGVMLWELLYGERPFRDEQLQAGWSATLEDMTARRRAGVPAAPAAIKGDAELVAAHAIISRCLEPNVENRFASGGELARQLSLCLQPRTQRLLAAPAGDWRALVKSRPLFAMLVATVVPNALAGVFNYIYNEAAIVRKLGSEQAQEVFWSVQAAINSTAFPLGGVIALWACWPMAQALWKLTRGERLPAESLTHARRRALSIGKWAAVVGITEWFAAGLIYPLVLRLRLGELPAHAYFHFFASHAVCGLIAAAYPFFFASFLSLRAFYPGLLVATTGEADDEPYLLRLGRRAGVYLLVAGGVPTLGLMLLVLGGIEVENRAALAVLSIAGVAGLALAFWMYRLLQHDLAALLVAVRPRDSFGTVSDSMEVL